MTRTVDAAVSRQTPSPDRDPAAARLAAFIGLLAIYLLFASLLLVLGYGLWPALAGAATACAVAGEVARRVLAGAKADPDAAALEPGAAPLELAANSPCDLEHDDAQDGRAGGKGGK